jgi:hypothetical protein
MMRQCKLCKQLKEDSCFHRYSDEKRTLYARCKACDHARQMVYRYSKLETLTEKQRAKLEECKAILSGGDCNGN